MNMFIRRLSNRRGSQMTEAAITLPLVILAAMLLVRMFVFYLDILTAGITEHRKALEIQDAYRGAVIRTHEEEKKISLLSGVLLKTDVSKRLRTRVYLINEDFLVRSSEILE
jgi:hypothetical protein